MKKRIAILFLVLSFGLIAFKAADDYFEISKNLEIFAGVYKEVHTSYVDDVKSGELIRAGIDGMLKSLDPYTVFYSEAQAEDYRFQITGTYAGVGSSVRKIGEDFVITDLFENYPADLAGLRIGDKLIEIDGTDLSGKTMNEVSERLRGKSGSTISIKVVRADSSIFEVSFERANISTDNVPYYALIGNSIGYVKLTGFRQGAAKEVLKSLTQLKEEGAKAFILDLRGNGGGLMFEAIDIVNLFVAKGNPVVTTKGKHREQDQTYRTLNQPFDISTPLAVLIDEGSASASEIVSGALQDLDRAVIIGRNSFGKGLVQGTQKLPYNSQMKLTIAKYYLPSGRLIQRLDYGNKINGKAIKVSDSAKSTFLTSSGRPVIDGEGIQPDIKVERAEYSKITQVLVSENLLFNFAAYYRCIHDSIVPARELKVDDLLYKEFMNFLSDKNISYQIDTEKQLAELKRMAEKENVSQDLFRHIETLEADLQSYKNNDLLNHKQEIKERLQLEIAGCYYYMKGRIEASFDDDKDLLAAFDLFSDLEHYNSLLKP